MNIERPRVELLTCTPNACYTIEACGRESYGSPISNDEAGNYKWIKARIAGWEHDVLEHASATFVIVCSRVVSHELVRHRIASYTQQSMRFREVQETDLCMIPDFVKDEDVEQWYNHYMCAFEVFRWWRERGYNKDQARYHLPLGSSTRIACTWNFREIRHIIEMRTPKRANAEIRKIAKEIRDICIESWPAVFDEYKEEEDAS